MQRRTHLEGIAQLRRCGPQARGCESREGGRIRLTVRHGLQHAARADAEQVRHDTGDLDVRLLEQCLQPVLKLHAVPRDLVLPPHDGAPEPLLSVGHKAQGQLRRDQPFHQPLRIRKVLLPTAGPAIRLRLREMERARQARRTGARAPLWPPVLLQGFPHRPPVLRGRFHDDFLDLLLDEPTGPRAQVGRRCPDLLACEVEVAVDLDVGNHDRQHLLVDVNSRDSVRHGSPPGGTESVPRRINQGRELSVGLLGAPSAQLFGQSRTLRIKQLLGLTGATGWFDLAVPAATIMHTLIFIVFGGPEAYLNSCGNRPVRRASQINEMKSATCKDEPVLSA
jgi:hypothetical protein